MRNRTPIRSLAKTQTAGQSQLAARVISRWQAKHSGLGMLHVRPVGTRPKEG